VEKDDLSAVKFHWNTMRTARLGKSEFEMLFLN